MRKKSDSVKDDIDSKLPRYVIISSFSTYTISYFVFHK